MLLLEWWTRVWPRRRNRACFPTGKAARKERRLRLLRLEQRRVLNADFTFTAGGSLTMTNVDGDVVVREVGERIEFDLHGSIWQDVGSNAPYTLDNSQPNHSILSFDRNDLRHLATGILIAADPNGSHDLVLDTRDAALNLRLDAGPLVIRDFDDVEQVGTHDLRTNDLSVTAEDRVELQSVVSDDVSLIADRVLLHDSVQTNGGSFASFGAEFDSTTATIAASGGVEIVHTGTVWLGTINTGFGSGGTVLLDGVEVRHHITAGDGNIEIHGGNGHLEITANVTANGSITLIADQDVLISSPVEARGPGSDLTISADADADGRGGVWLYEGDPDHDAALSAERDVVIRGSSLLATADGFDSLRIDGDGTALQVVAGQDIHLLAGVGSAPSLSGDIVLDGRQSATLGDITAIAHGEIWLAADQTAGRDLLFASSVRLRDNVLLQAAADVIFNDTLDDDGDLATGSALTVLAGDEVLFVRAVGANANDRLDSLTVADAGSVDFLSTVTLDGDMRVTTLSSAGPTEGRINFHGAVTTTAGLTSGSIEIRNAGPLTISSQAAFDVAGRFQQLGFGATELGANLTTHGGGVFFNDAVLLTSSVTIDTSSANGDITFRGPIDSEDDGVTAEHNSLTLAAGTGRVSFASDLGAGTNGDQTLGSLTVESASHVAFGVFDDGDPGTPGPLTSIQLDGALDIGVGNHVIENGIEFYNVSGLLNLVTTDDAVRFNGAVSLRTSLDINTNATGIGGNVTFTSAASIDGQPDGSHGLSIDAGSRRVVFNNDVGRTNAIGTFTITQADGGVIFGESDTFVGFDLTGPVTTIHTQGEINLGVDANVIVGGIVLNGGLDTLRITTPDRTVRFNGAVTLESDVEINTNADLTGIPDDDFLPTPTPGATVTFTSAATIDSQDGECNDLIIDAGSQQVLFNANLGIGAFGDQRLGRLTINQADSGVIFGESDVDLGPGATGPVTAIATCDAIDLGVAGHVIGGAGIVLNAGNDTLHLTTRDASVRFNGAVTLASALEIDTNATLDTGGGSVTFTAAASIDSETGEANDLTIDAGTQQVLFNNNLGESQTLGTLTITQADAGVRFGQAGLPGEADLGQHPDELGLVTVIATEGAIDLGVGSHVIEGGIVLNGGDGVLAITTTDDTVRFNGFVTLASDVHIDTNFTLLTGGATVRFTQAAAIDSLLDETLDINGDPTYFEHNDLTIDAGVAQVLFNNDLGTVQPLGALTIVQADFGVIFGQSDTDQGPGTTGPVARIVTDDAIDIGVDDHVIEGAGIVLNAGTEVLLLSTTDDTVRFNGAVRLLTDLRIDTTSETDDIGGTVTFTESATIDSETGQFHDLFLDVGTQAVLFNNNLGESQALGTFTIERADGGVIFGESAERQGPGTTGPVSIISTSGPIDIGVGSHVITAGIEFNAGEGTLLITTGDDQPPLDPAEPARPVRFNGAITLVSDVEIHTFASPTGGGRTVLFTSAATIDSGPLGEPRDLTINAGSQQVLFNNNLGESNPLGLLTITRADGGVIFGQTDTDEGPGTTGPVTLIATEEAIDIGSGTNVISGGIVLNGGGDTLTITTTDAPVRFNGPITLASHVDLNTNTSGVGGDVTFTAAATIDSQAAPDDEHNDLTIDAGTGRVFFNNNIGAAQSLGRFTITQAEEVFLGQDDSFKPPGPLGPVNRLITEGPIDIGVGQNVITDGIQLNGGLFPNSELIPVLIESRQGSVRFNGLIVSHVEPLDMDGLPVDLPEVDLTIRAATGVTLTNDSGILTDDYNVVINGDTDDDAVGDVVMEELTRIVADAGYIDLRGANVFLGEVETTNGNLVGNTNPAVKITATFGAISDVNDDELNIIARTVASDTDRAGVVLDAVLGIGTGNALETDIKSLIAFNHDLDVDGDDIIDIPADGNIELHDVGASTDFPVVNDPRTGSEHKVDLVFVHNQANPLFTGDTDRGVIDINVELGNLRVLDDGSRGLLEEMIFGIDPGDLAVAAVQSENTIRLTADTIEIFDDLLAIQDEPASGDDLFEIIELNARADFFLEPNRVITTDQNYVGSLAFSFEDTNQNRRLDPGEDTNANNVLDYDPDPKPKTFADDTHRDVIRIIADFDRNGRSKSTHVTRDSNSHKVNRVIVDQNENGVVDIDFKNNGEDNDNAGPEDLSEDVNNNGVLDPSEDANNNGLLDPGEDTNGNGVLDLSEDTNGNGLLDTHSDGLVYLGEGATISTNSGIEQRISIRPDSGLTDTAFFERETVVASDLRSNGFGPDGELLLGTLRITIGVPGEKNLVLDIDWGDLTPPFQENIAAPSLQPDGSYLFDLVLEKRATRFLIPEGGLIYELPHEYTNLSLNFPEGQPGRTRPSDPFQVRFAVSQHLSLLIEGRSVLSPDGSTLTNVPLSAPLAPETIPLALLSSTDVRDDPALLLPRFDDGVAKFVIPTTKVFSLPLNRDANPPPPELPKLGTPEPPNVAPQQQTTETAASSAASSSVTTDEFFELRRINEDGLVEYKERLTGDYDGELLLSNKEAFERFVRERGDGDYEIWFITKDIREGALIERPVVQFRLESGRIAPPPDDSPFLFQPLKLIPVPQPPNQDARRDDADSTELRPDAHDGPMSDTPVADADAFAPVVTAFASASSARLLVSDEALDHSAPSADATVAVATTIASEPLATSATAPRTLSLPTAPETDGAPFADGLADVTRDADSAEASLWSDAGSLVAGVLVFAATRRWKSRANPSRLPLFSKCARFARKRPCSADDQ